MPAVLGRLLMPPLRRMELSSVRLVNIYGTVQPKPALKQLTVNEVGHFRYERDRSRDSKMANPQKLGDTPIRWVKLYRVLIIVVFRFLVRRLGHAFELYPLFVLFGFWAVIFTYTVYISFEKIEVWLDRSKLFLLVAFIYLIFRQPDSTLGLVSLRYFWAKIRVALEFSFLRKFLGRYEIHCFRERVRDKYWKLPTLV